MVVFISWTDDLAIFGPRFLVDMVKKDLVDALKCKPEGELVEYVGSNIDITRKSDGLGVITFTQPVLIQNLEDEYDLPGGDPPKTPAVAGNVLVKGDGSDTLVGQEATKFRSATAVCMYIQ